MENDIALIAASYLAVRLGVLFAIAYAIYWVVRPAPKSIPIRNQSRYAGERASATRAQR